MCRELAARRMACYRPETVSHDNVGHDDNQARAATSMASTPVSSVGWVTGAKFGEWLGCPGRSVRPAWPCCKYPGPCLKRAGLPHIRFHDLRHTCATLLLSKNVHPKFVQELLGHATIAITLDTYSHVLPSMGAASSRVTTQPLDPLAPRRRAVRFPTSSRNASFSGLRISLPLRRPLTLQGKRTRNRKQDQGE